MARYGRKGTWALVTGGSDGIGAEFCKQLAKKGFNICIVSRTQAKMEKVENDIKRLSNSGIKTRIVQADFSGNSNTDFYRDIA